jgi:hypothetical protein
MSTVSFISVSMRRRCLTSEGKSHDCLRMQPFILDFPVPDLVEFPTSESLYLYLYGIPYTYMYLYRGSTKQGWYIFIPKIAILVYFGGPWNGKRWYILLSFGIPFYGHLV